MALNYVTLTLDLYDGTGNSPTSGTATFVPSAVLTDAGVGMFGQQPIVVAFKPGAAPVVKLLATDNAGIQPGGWTWNVTFSGISGAPAAANFALAYASGAAQFLSAVY